MSGTVATAPTTSGWGLGRGSQGFASSRVPWGLRGGRPRARRVDGTLRSVGCKHVNERPATVKERRTGTQQSTLPRWDKSASSRSRPAAGGPLGPRQALAIRRHRGGDAPATGPIRAGPVHTGRRRAGDPRERDRMKSAPRAPPTDDAIVPSRERGRRSPAAGLGSTPRRTAMTRKALLEGLLLGAWIAVCCALRGPDWDQPGPLRWLRAANDHPGRTWIAFGMLLMAIQRSSGCEERRPERLLGSLELGNAQSGSYTSCPVAGGRVVRPTTPTAAGPPTTVEAPAEPWQ